MKKRTYSNPVGVSRFAGLLLISPFIAGFLIFTLYPFVSSFILGLTDYNGNASPEFTGFENYITLIRSEDFRNAVKVTLRVDETAIMDYIFNAVKFFVTSQQIYFWRKN